ncbi:hypothetical protein CPB86DRAFT_348354, partial [Serendipita vermifera]
MSIRSMEMNNQMPFYGLITTQLHTLSTDPTVSDITCTGGEQAQAETITAEPSIMGRSTLDPIEKAGSAEGPTPPPHLNSDAETECLHFSISRTPQIPSPTPTSPGFRSSPEYPFVSADIRHWVDLGIIDFGSEEEFQNTNDRVAHNSQTSELISELTDTRYSNQGTYVADLVPSAHSLVNSNDNPLTMTPVPILENCGMINTDGVSRESNEHRQNAYPHSNTVTELPSFNQPVAQVMIQNPFDYERPPHSHDFQLPALSKESLAFPNMPYTGFNFPTPSA